MADDRAAMLASPAYLALTPSGQRALRLIVGEVERQGGGPVTMPRSAFVAHGMGKVSVTFATRQLRLTGFVVIELGERRATVFRLVDGWRALDAEQAAKLVKQARLPLPRPAPKSAKPKPVKAAPTPTPKPVEPPREVERRTPSLPRLSFMDDGR